ncbi:ABC transporter permease, partial [Prosthecomicrobium hirschii]
MSAVPHEHATGYAVSPAGSPSSLLTVADRLVGNLVEAAAALLVAAEIVVLFAGVLSRYVFHSPIVWSDELASILF